MPHRIPHLDALILASLFLFCIADVAAGSGARDRDSSDRGRRSESGLAECREAVRDAQIDHATCIAPAGVDLLFSSVGESSDDPGSATGNESRAQLRRQRQWLRRADRCQARHDKAIDEIRWRYVRRGGVEAEACGLEVEKASLIGRLIGYVLDRLGPDGAGGRVQIETRVSLEVQDVTDAIFRDPAVTQAYPYLRNFVDHATHPNQAVLLGTAATDPCACTEDGWCASPAQFGYPYVCIDQAACVPPIYDELLLLSSCEVNSFAATLVPGTNVLSSLRIPFCSSTPIDPTTCRTLPYSIGASVVNAVYPPATGDTMNPGEALAPWITSANGLYTLVFQSDGNLVLYENGSTNALWASGTNISNGGIGPGSGPCIMQEDGDLVIYGTLPQPIGFGQVFSTGTGGHPGSRLVVQNDGNVVIYTPDGTALWATNTVQP
jgi:hypothetical protein